MSGNKSLWELGAEFMNSIGARDRTTAQELLEEILERLNQECRGRQSVMKLRTLQMLTNANRAAYNAGASTEALAEHSCLLIKQFDRSITQLEMTQYARVAVDSAIAFIPEQLPYQERRIREAIDYIVKNLDKPISREQLATKTGCSPSHFSRLFSKVTGQTYRSFIQKSRLKKAGELLRKSSLNVSEIALAVGYQDPFQFSKTFRKHFGRSPRQYRDTRPSDPGTPPSMPRSGDYFHHEKAQRPMVSRP